MENEKIKEWNRTSCLKCRTLLDTLSHPSEITCPKCGTQFDLIYLIKDSEAVPEEVYIQYKDITGE